MKANKMKLSEALGVWADYQAQAYKQIQAETSPHSGLRIMNRYAETYEQQIHASRIFGVLGDFEYGWQEDSEEEITAPLEDRIKAMEGGDTEERDASRSEWLIDSLGETLEFIQEIDAIMKGQQ